MISNDHKCWKLDFLYIFSRWSFDVLVGLVGLMGLVGIVGLVCLLGLVSLIGWVGLAGLVSRLGIFYLFDLTQKYFQTELLSCLSIRILIIH